jgi:hypothetical protein
MPEIVAELPKNKRERIRVALDRYADHDLVDIRICTPISENAGLWGPTKKGISVRVASLPDLIDALIEAENRAIEKGLLEGGARSPSASSTATEGAGALMAGAPASTGQAAP